MTKRAYFLVSLCMVLVIWSAGCSGPPGNGGGPLSLPGGSSNADLILTESHLQPGSSSEMFAYVAGSVQNNGGKTYSTVEVAVTLYDANGKEVGFTMATGNNLAPGGVWNFEAPLGPNLQQKTVSYKIKSIRGF